MMTPTSSTPVTEFEAVRRLQSKDEKGNPREQTVKYKADGKGEFVEPESQAKFALNSSSFMTTALVVPEAAGPARFEAVLDNGRYTPEKVFRDPAGRTIEGSAPNRMQVPSDSALVVGLLVNAANFLLWLVAFWLGLRFAFGHAVGLAILFGGATMVILMPLLFNANGLPPGR
jgi:hypothetical protein